MTSNQYKHTMTFPSDTEIYIEREFDAPAELLFKVYSDPEMVPQWWGPRKYSTRVDVMDVRVGGKWRFIQSDENGNEFGFRGEYKEIIPGKKVSYTFEFEPLAGHIMLETVELEEKNGKTLVKVLDAFSSKEDRDGMVQSGMEDGMNEANERLDELLETLKK
jgi:uncharacterized protein YndB with AHSA1/START domain